VLKELVNKVLGRSEKGVSEKETGWGERISPLTQPPHLILIFHTVPFPSQAVLEVPYTKAKHIFNKQQ